MIKKICLNLYIISLHITIQIILFFNICVITKFRPYVASKPYFIILGFNHNLITLNTNKSHEYLIISVENWD